MNDNATTTEQKQKDDYEVDTNLYTIGGTVWKMAQGNETPKRKPWKQVRVEVKDTGMATQTDDKGRYKLNRLRPGEYTLIIRKKSNPAGKRYRISATADHIKSGAQIRFTSSNSSSALSPFRPYPR